MGLDHKVTFWHTSKHVYVMMLTLCASLSHHLLSLDAILLVTRTAHTHMRPRTHAHAHMKRHLKITFATRLLGLCWRRKIHEPVHVHLLKYKIKFTHRLSTWFAKTHKKVNPNNQNSFLFRRMYPRERIYPYQTSYQTVEKPVILIDGTGKSLLQNSHLSFTKREGIARSISLSVGSAGWSLHSNT